MTESSSDYLYRILPFNRLVQILKTDHWYFAHPSEWDDPFEVRRKTVLSPHLFAQCWCGTAVSDAMWRIYSPNGLGARVRVSRQTLKEKLKQVAKANSLQFHVQNVKYLKQSELAELEGGWIEPDSDGISFKDAATHLFKKRLPFAHESETRVVILDRGTTSTRERPGNLIKLGSTELIHSIFLDPRAPIEVTDALEHYLKNKMKFPHTVAKSSLYKSETRAEPPI